ncbi:Chromosome transmission fidelity protein 18 [Coemansia sp. RSA 1813]|nr:Chromosome transmission fidelity protein 18 [Coemansia sp. RSA 1646]KAJ1770894.1 Chromosome transmission fidelity protein 18 [Coemansia sp. RSA 1843]KAJ2092895.1 Chromosome transmission fidelity protein 18 [Coemansia sp. RSA 986]KAJ2216216.1 Chromosome transmission fidelity protein 18 [Coemansia sp. RSA 487]KAJ2570611.1 Chromosome transmission fidelity protein 18 [Coemansia sp. RSA 1813]
MQPEELDLRQSLLGSTLGTSLLSDTTQLESTQSDIDRQTPANALNQLGQASSSAHAEAIQFPATLDDAADFMEEEDELSNGLTLLPTAEYSDEEEDGDAGQTACSQFGQFSEARVVSDPHTGQVVLQAQSKPILSEEDYRDAERQGTAVAGIISNKKLREELGNKVNLANHSIAVFSPSERYSAYKSALEQQARVDEKMELRKRQKMAHNTDEEMGDDKCLSDTAEMEVAASKGADMPLMDILSSKYALPPETGDFITSRTSKGRNLYFALRSEIEAKKKLCKIAALKDEGGMSSSQINRVVADIEHELDTAAALEASKMDVESNDNAEMKEKAKERGRQCSSLWVDKYRAQSFLDLVSDERTNRAVMQWLKEWDYCVFGREKPPASTAPNAYGANRQIPGDKWKRPQRRILLLSGPPGLGKTTLAHVAAKQAGYATVEINASDDRTVSKIKDRVLGVTQTQTMSSVPQLLIIDEIDGVSGAHASQGGDFISMLVKLADDHQPAAGGPKTRRRKDGPLLRPIICICNNVYAPVLRPLRQIALSYHVYPPTSARLAKRLEEVCQVEGVTADTWSLVELAKQNEGDVRSCLNMLQLLCARTKSISLETTQQGATGVKDVQRSLFAIWGMVFTKPDASSVAFSRATQSSLKKKSVGPQTIDSQYASLIIDAVRSSGEHERLMQGCFENYLRMEFRDLTHTKVADLCTDWLAFYDSVDFACRRNPSTAGVLHAYLDFAPLAIHRACSTPVGLSRGNFEYPHSEYEAFQARQTAQGIMQALVSGCLAVRSRSFGSAMAALGFVDYFLHILSPQLTTSNKHLLKGPEKERFDRLVEVMGGWQVSFVQSKDTDGQFVYKVEPQIDRLFGFQGRRPALPVMPMRYPVRQLVAQELERIRIARAVAKQNSAQADSVEESAMGLAKRDYLAKLFANPLTGASNGSKHKVEEEAPEPVVKDFFGRIVTKSKKPTKTSSSSSNTKQPGIKDGPCADNTNNSNATRTWFHFFEGFSNAVRKPTQMKELF